MEEAFTAIAIVGGIIFLGFVVLAVLGVIASAFHR